MPLRGTTMDENRDDYRGRGGGVRIPPFRIFEGGSYGHEKSNPDGLFTRLKHRSRHVYLQYVPQPEKGGQGSENRSGDEVGPSGCQNCGGKILLPGREMHPVPY